MINYLGLLCSSIVSTYIFYNFLEAIYERKYCTQKIYLISYIIYLVISFTLSILEIPIINITCTIAMMVLILLLFYDIKKKNVLINFIIFISYIVACDTAITMLFSLIQSNSNTELSRITSSVYLFSGIANSILLTCTHNVLIQKIKHYPQTKISISVSCYMLFLLFFELLIISYLLLLNFYALPLLLISIGFSIVNVGVFSLCRSISKNSLLEKQAQLLEQQKSMTLKYCEDLQRRYDETQKLLHDIKKHIQVINNLDGYDDSLKAAYSNNLIKSINEKEQQFQCSNKIVNAIIWNKILQCNQLNIEFNIDMEDLDFNFMSDMELTSLFSNLLENAIESCVTSDETDKEISLRIHQFKEYIVLRLRNTLEQMPIENSGRLISTKPGHLGLGMLILKELVEKYNGNLKCDYMENYFETKIILSSLK